MAEECCTCPYADMTEAEFDAWDCLCFTISRAV